MGSTAAGVPVPNVRDRDTGVPNTDRHARHAQLLADAKNGDRAALDALVAELTPLIWHVARAAGCTQPEAEDVVQSTWLALLDHMQRIQEPKSLAGWLVVTARRIAQRLRSSQVALDRVASSLVTEQTAAGTHVVESPETGLVQDEDHAALWRAFARLPERGQELLRLLTSSGTSYADVAQSLNMPVGSIGPARTRTLNQLRKLLEEEHGRDTSGDNTTAWTVLKQWGVATDDQARTVRAFIDRQRRRFDNPNYGVLRRPIPGLEKNRLELALDEPDAVPVIPDLMPEKERAAMRAFFHASGARVVRAVLDDLRAEFPDVRRPEHRRGRKGAQKDLHELYQALSVVTAGNPGTVAKTPHASNTRNR
ncbi:sigma-70 family RNA polymerase sigma factor [Saccharothrix sp.]|uniref:RNA polymerase sigma factor n=1 Tax=Saccharothrix sp. TaxID=1873460 RepID=UPI002811BF7C|nr:sigma-70 family RNA polymerase sigma factor [Saccharothrix sp.]